MKATFVELPPFASRRAQYLDDDAFRELQHLLMEQPHVGDVIQGAGGLRVIYFRWESGAQIWLFTLYDKDEVADLTQAQRKALRDMVKAEIGSRSM